MARGAGPFGAVGAAGTGKDPGEAEDGFPGVCRKVEIPKIGFTVFCSLGR